VDAAESIFIREFQRRYNDTVLRGESTDDANFAAIPVNSRGFGLVRRA
jgi:hypothetical protein